MIGPSRDRQARDEETGARRNYWGCARERNRRLARSAIKKRIEGGDTITNVNDSANPLLTVENVPIGLYNVPIEWLDKVLWNIIKGKRAFFSLTCVQDNLAYFESPHPADCLFSADQQELKGKAQMINWFGKEGYDIFREAVRNELETFTIYEYAVWCRRWQIVGSLLIGAVNPCVRGKWKKEKLDCLAQPYDDNRSALIAFGPTILRQLFDKCVPLSLSSHAIRQLVESRRNAVVGICPMCSIQEVLLCCDRQGCSGVCELCWWKNLGERLDGLENQLVSCLVCTTGSQTCDDMAEPQIQERDQTTCRDELRRQYMELPKDIKELKERLSSRSDKKKHAEREDDLLVTTWSAAVVSSMGSTREIRRDRFFIRITKGHFHYVKGFLTHGIDIDMQNEYGQTGLYLAAWLGHAPIVSLILEHGADANICAHGGSTALCAARANGHKWIVQFLIDQGASVVRRDCTWDNGDLLGQERQLEILIDISTDHSGAGAFMIDHAVTDETIDSLRKLWQSIPVEVTAVKQNKSKICSDRSYYCDTEGFVRKAIVQAIVGTLGTGIDHDKLIVLEHMRFLSYSMPGAVLLPHTDLQRIDMESGVHSTHTFILYMTTCQRGGETSLLEHTHGLGRDCVLARVVPTRGRLLLFPHNTPHEGKEVIDVPKLLIRGEVILPFT